MIPTPLGWMRLVRRDFVHLRSPRETPVGEIKYREQSGPLRTAQQIVGERLAYPALEAMTIGPPDRLTTHEGEHAATVRIEGSISGHPILRVTGIVFSEHVTAIVDAVSAQPQHFLELETIARDCVLRTTLGLGVRRRRFMYRRPPRWQAFAHGMVTHYIPPDHPRNSAHAVVHPAVPRGLPPQQVIRSMFEDQIGAMTELEYLAEEPVHARDGLRGSQWSIRSHTPSGRSRSHLVVLFEDHRYVYPLHFDDGADAADRETFAAMCASVEPLGPGVAASRRALTRRDRLAILGAARGTAAIEHTNALVASGRFTTIDAFHDQRDPSARSEQLPQRDMQALTTDPAPYHALYAPHGQLRNFVPHVLRPHADWAPVICELATAHSASQWLHLWIAAVTGAMRATDGFVFDSAAARDLHLEVWQHWSVQFGSPIPRTFVIPSAIDADAHRRDERTRASGRRELGLTPDDVVVLHPGRVANADEMIALWREVLAQAPRAVLLLPGGEDRASLDRARRVIRQAGVANRVIVAEGAAHASLVSAADVLALVAIDIERACAPIVLEAMAHGVPVIAPRGFGCSDIVRDGEDGIVVDVVQAPVSDALRDTLFGRNPTLHAADVSRHASCDPRMVVAALVRLTTDAELRTRLGRHALGGVRQRHSVHDAARRRVEVFDDIADRAREAWTADAARPVRRLVDLDDVVRELASHRLAPDTQVAVGRRDAVAALPDAHAPAFRAVADAVLQAASERGPSPLHELATTIGTTTDELAAALVRMIAVHAVECDSPVVPPSSVPQPEPARPGAPGRDRLAILGGFVQWNEAAPHGSNHAAFAYSTGIARTRRFSEIDVYHDRDPTDSFAPPDGISVRMRELRSLVDAPERYRVIYVAHGDQLYYAPHLMRPHADWAPVVYEVGTTHHVAQWLHLLVGAATGAVRATDGVVFACSAAQRVHHHAWEAWRDQLGCVIPISTVISNAIECDAHRRDDGLRASTRRELGVADDAPVFLVFGRLSAYTKGDQVSLVALWREVAGLAPDAILVLAGATDDPAHVDRLRRTARELGVADRVIVVENPYARWPAARTALMSAADALLHLSTGLEETASLVVLEAMAHQLPVIASRWSGAAEILRGEEGILVDVWSAPVPEALRAGVFGRNPQLVAGEASRYAACDARQAIAAVVGLATNAERRRNAGEAALRAVRERHDVADAMQRRIAFFDEVATRAEAAWTGRPRPVRRLVDVERVLRTLGGH